jgi:hypothetical protein
LLKPPNSTLPALPGRPGAARCVARRTRPATIARKLAAIAVYHRSMDHPTPTDHDVMLRAVVRGSRRQLGVAQPQKTELEIDALRTVVLAIPEDLYGLRDRALLLVD